MAHDSDHKKGCEKLKKKLNVNKYTILGLH